MSNNLVGHIQFGITDKNDNINDIERHLGLSFLLAKF